MDQCNCQDQSVSSFAWIGSFFRHRTACRRGDILFVFFFQQLKQVGDERFFEEITLEPAVDEEIDDAVRPKQGQVLGDIGLAYIEGIFEIAHALDALSEFLKDFDSDGMGNDFEEIDSFLNGNHFVGFSF
jgi:hypothetical protein